MTFSLPEVYNMWTMTHDNRNNRYNYIAYIVISITQKC